MCSSIDYSSPDLAARNVLVGQNETCKVTDFGMARDVLEENIYERKTKVMTADNEMNKSLIRGA